MYGFRNPFLPQFMQDPGRAKLAPAHGGELLDEARLRQPAAPFQLIEQQFDLFRVLSEWLQFGLELLARMLAPRQGFQGSRAQV